MDSSATESDDENGSAGAADRNLLGSRRMNTRQSAQKRNSICSLPSSDNSSASSSENDDNNDHDENSRRMSSSSSNNILPTTVTTVDSSSEEDEEDYTEISIEWFKVYYQELVFSINSKTVGGGLSTNNKFITARKHVIKPLHNIITGTLDPQEWNHNVVSYLRSLPYLRIESVSDSIILSNGCDLCCSSSSSHNTAGTGSTYKIILEGVPAEDNNKDETNNSSASMGWIIRSFHVGSSCVEKAVRYSILYHAEKHWIDKIQQQLTGSGLSTCQVVDDSKIRKQYLLYEHLVKSSSSVSSSSSSTDFIESKQFEKWVSNKSSTLEFYKERYPNMHYDNVEVAIETKVENDEEHKQHDGMTKATTTTCLDGWRARHSVKRKRIESMASSSSKEELEDDEVDGSVTHYTTRYGVQYHPDDGQHTIELDSALHEIEESKTTSESPPPNVVSWAYQNPSVEALQRLRSAVLSQQSNSNTLEPISYVVPATCLVCNCQPANAIVCHGVYGHQYCCYSCAVQSRDFKTGCLVCGRQIENVIKAMPVSQVASDKLKQWFL